jgi:hypothetical protein
MPRARTVTISEVQDRLGGNTKARFFTTKRGQKAVIFEKKHPFPRGKGVRLEFKRKSAGNLTDELRTIKRRQEKAERLAGVKRGNGLFDNPLSGDPNVIGVKRIIRKQQVAKQVRLHKAGKIPIHRLSKKAQARVLGLAKKQGAKIPKGVNAADILFITAQG